LFAQIKKELKMKKFKSLIFAAALFGTISIVAVNNKQQIRIINNYGQHVLVHTNWRYGALSIPGDSIISPGENKGYILKAPISGYTLFSIDVTPAQNLTAVTAGGVGLIAGDAALPVAAGAAGIAYGVTHSMNHRTIRAHGNNFFVIEKSKKNSQISSQKQIEITGYKGRSEYSKSLESKNNEQNKKKMNNSGVDQNVLENQAASAA